MTLKPQFGDEVENGWASENNPTRRGFFVREFVRSGKLNPGRTWEITDGKGNFWELQPSYIGERLKVSPAAREESRPDPRPSPVGREEVARVIDPEAWWAENPLLQSAPDRIDARKQSSLGKADAILALFSPADGWRPIETAPKDGTKVLVCGPHENGGTYQAVTAWPKGWVARWPVSYEAYAADEPTHWRPLPAAPPPPGGQG